jgi:hypothetical protein
MIRDLFYACLLYIYWIFDLTPFHITNLKLRIKYLLLLCFIYYRKTLKHFYFYPVLCVSNWVYMRGGLMIIEDTIERNLCIPPTLYGSLDNIYHPHSAMCIYRIIYANFACHQLYSLYNLWSCIAFCYLYTAVKNIIDDN